MKGFACFTVICLVCPMKARPREVLRRRLSFRGIYRRKKKMYKVLLADDEGLVRELLKKNLELSGLPVRVVATAGNGREALQKAEELRPDIVIADIVMPFMNGLEFLGQLQKKNLAVKTLIISGYDEFEYAQKAISLGVSEYLLKPFLPQELFAAVRKIIDRLEQKEEMTANPDAETANGQETGQTETADRKDRQAVRAVRAAQAYIKEHLQDGRLSIDETAEVVHFSVSYLRQIFKEVTGDNFNEYLIRQRMEKAAELLGTTSLKIQEIAEACGYDDQRYFASSFKKQYGCTPTKFKTDRRNE
ncbi:DNA-binding response regulator [Lachnospiraceae bacterium oral taxon 500]|nr:DNA-binding response regulator [Lachnospiraceae bacterium oral taxon 500]